MQMGGGGGGSAAGTTATPPGDALTSQLPVKVFSGNKKPYLPVARESLILANSAHKGYFASAIAYNGANLRPLSENAKPPGGAPGGGVDRGMLRKSRGSQRKVKGSKLEAIAALQGRVGRGSSARTSMVHKVPKRLPAMVTAARRNKRPYKPISLGGGRLLRLPTANVS